MFHHFITFHRFWAYATAAFVFAVGGYFESRAFPRDPLMPITTWVFAVLWFAFDLATTRSLLPVGPVLGLAVLIGGFAWMARYYRRHRSARDRQGQ